MAGNRYTDDAGVLKNALGIVDRQELADVEYTLAIFKARSLHSQHDRRHDLDRLCSIHAHLFDELYEWAGKVRTVPIEKYNPQSRTVTVFAAPDKIVDDWRVLEGKIGRLLASPRGDFPDELATLTDIYIEANRIHPFAEGNGRSLQVFMRSLAQERGVELDFSKTHAEAWNRASALSATHGRLFERTHFITMPTDSGPIKVIFENIAAPVAPAEDPTVVLPFVVSEKELGRLASKVTGQLDALAIVERVARSRGYSEDEVVRAVASARRSIDERAKAAQSPKLKITDPAAQPTIPLLPPSQQPDTPKRGY